MAFITIEDLRTHYYDENASIITRDDDTIITAAIDGAIQEAKGYRRFCKSWAGAQRSPSYFCKGYCSVAFHQPLQRRQ